MLRRLGLVLACVVAAAMSGCGASGNTSHQGSGGSLTGTGGSATTHEDGGGGSTDGGSNVGGANTGGSSANGGGGANAGGGGGSNHDTLDSNRDRLLKSYFAYLKANASTPQSNGLSKNNVASVCDVWSKLDPSSRSVFLTLTARLQGSILGSDGSSMLSHVIKVYRIAGGEGATMSDPGSCGGGEFNRMIMSEDDALHTAQLAANQHQGGKQANGKYDIADAPPGGTFWRDSHDAGGPHGPFDLSDETDTGAPRGQTQYFKDPSSAAANAPLGRQDLATLVDPNALEMDEDYDCIHNSNPLCSYTTYGAFCLPQSSKLGTDIFEASYGSIDASYAPAGCP
jgi:hypothetical protein